MRCLRAGDEAAFAVLVERYHPAMVRLARAYAPSREVAEEAAQEAWLGLLRGLDAFEERSSVRTWLYRIVVNRAISAGRREHRHQHVDDGQLEDEGGRFTWDGWWATPPVHWADEAVDRIVAHDVTAAPERHRTCCADPRRSAQRDVTSQSPAPEFGLTFRTSDRASSDGPLTHRRPGPLRWSVP